MHSMNLDNPRRRRFLKILAIGSLGTAVVALAVLRLRYRAIRDWWLRPDTEAVPGELHESAVRTLLAVTETVTNPGVELAHYEAFFRWRARTLPGHRALYERLAVVIDRDAQARAGRPFADCTGPDRAAVLGRLEKLRRSRLRRVLAAALDRDWLLLDVHLIQPVLDLFANTDAWVLLGYPAWPGTPRGFEFHGNPERRKPARISLRRRRRGLIFRG